MQLYLIQAHVDAGEGTQPFWARSWKSSQADASKERTRFVDFYGLKRSEVSITAIEVDTRKEALIHLLNRICTQTNGKLSLD